MSCREKKKAKLQEQASKVEQLSAHVEGLSQLNADVQSLEQQNLELESSLWAKEAELNQLKCAIPPQCTTFEDTKELCAY